MPDTNVQQSSGRSLPVHNQNVLFRSVADGAVIFSVEDEVYFGLNGVGAQVWELLGSFDCGESLMAEMIRRYPDAHPDAIRADVSELIADLVANHLVVPRESGSTEGDHVAAPAA